jgi:hypothetical protein
VVGPHRRLLGVRLSLRRPSASASAADTAGLKSNVIAAIRARACRRPRDTPIWKQEAALKCRSCRKGRYDPPVHIKLTERQEITPYTWVTPAEERWEQISKSRICEKCRVLPLAAHIPKMASTSLQRWGQLAFPEHFLFSQLGPLRLKGRTHQTSPTAMVRWWGLFWFGPCDLRHQN